MYCVIRCPGCRSFTYIDRFQKWKLCHVCGEVINTGKATQYIEVQDHKDAETIATQLERHLHDTGKKDLTPAELQKLRADYAQWVRNQV
jgi:hypothetical protein